jgi:hypothetical protein
VISSLVVETKKREVEPATLADPTLVGKIDRNLAPTEASWADLYLGEEEANRFTVDVSRLQKLLTTIILVIVYFVMVRSAFAQLPSYDRFVMPMVGANFVALLGASHAAYLAYKATPKSGPSSAISQSEVAGQARSAARSPTATAPASAMVPAAQRSIGTSADEGIDGCDLDFEQGPSTPDQELPVAVGGVA